MAFALNFVYHHVKTPCKSQRDVFLVSALLFYNIFIVSRSLTISRSETHGLEKIARGSERGRGRENKLRGNVFTS